MYGDLTYDRSTRLALESTQPPIHRTEGRHSQEIKRLTGKADHLHQNISDFKKKWSYSFKPTHAFRPCTKQTFILYTV